MGANDDYTNKQQHELVFEDDRIYKHQVCRINYTTYDMRRSQDCINVRTHPDVMVLSPHNDKHPYQYARALSIYHGYVYHPSLGEESTAVDFVFVRWYERDSTYPAGWVHRHLHRLAFVPESEGCFGFLDPREIIRAVHLIPAFSAGRTRDYLAASPIARPSSDEDEDWTYFYVNW
jgi:hypothetical protein